jgi:hypothetical protein
LLLKPGLLVAITLAALTAQQKEIGEVLFKNGGSKPFVSLECVSGYGPFGGAILTPCDIDDVSEPYSENVQEIVTSVNEGHVELLPSKTLNGLTRLKMLPLSPEERAVIKGCKAVDCDIHKVSLTFTDETENVTDLFVYLKPLGIAIGPEQQKYILSHTDIVGVVIKR